MDSTPSRTTADLLFLPDLERSIVNWLLRQQGATLSEISDHIDQDLEATQVLLDQLIDQGYLLRFSDQSEQTHYLPHLRSRKGRQVPGRIWDLLD
jgi:predicted transcriptional regulator